MFLLIDAEPQEYYSFIRSYYGIQVEIHARDDYPEMSNPIIVQPGYSARVLISPSVVNTDENVRRLPLSQRQCLFDDEVLCANWIENQNLEKNEKKYIFLHSRG